MKRCVIVIALLLTATSLSAQKRVDLIVDVEGVRRTGSNDNFVGARFEPEFSTGGGLGMGVAWFFADRLALELKAAGLVADVHIRRVGSDFVFNADLGNVQIYPLTAIVQWHLLERGAIRPYLGAGVGHVILRNIEQNVGTITGVKFEDPTGLVVNGGLQWSWSKRWSLNADARYIPIETSSEATILGPDASVELNLRPLVVAFGMRYHF